MRPLFGRAWSLRPATLVFLWLVISLPSAAQPRHVATTPVEPNNRPAERPVDDSVDDSNEYVIGPEDVLAVNVWKEPDVSRNVPVRPDGKISLPLIGELEASGLTPLQLQARIAERLEAYLSHPEVAVIVQEVKSQRFNVMGEVLHPGSFVLVKPMNVLDGIAVAGGFGDFAKLKKIYVLRRKRDGSGLRVPFNYKQVIQGRNLNQNVTLEPGDTIVVP